MRRARRKSRRTVLTCRREEEAQSPPLPPYPSPADGVADDLASAVLQGRRPSRPQEPRQHPGLDLLYWLQHSGLDLLNWLGAFFGFQRHNVRNQWEHLVLLLANEQMRLQPPPENLDILEHSVARRVRKKPLRNSIAFINGIEVVSAPDALIPHTVSPVGQTDGLSHSAFQVAYRINVSGPVITSANDTLRRAWGTGGFFLQSKSTTRDVSVSPSIIKYPAGPSPLIAPSSVYATAVQMSDAHVGSPNFNVTWLFDVDPSFAYFVRLHFCDIISKSLNDLYFNVYINGLMANLGLDLSNRDALVKSAATSLNSKVVSQYSSLLAPWLSMPFSLSSTLPIQTSSTSAMSRS